MRNSSLNIVVVGCIAFVGCAKGDKNESIDAAAPGAATAGAESNTAAAQVSVAPRPSDACGWITREEVEAVIGTLAEPPRPVGGACRYTLPIPEAVQVKRDKYVATMKKLQSLPGADPMPIRPFEAYAVDVHVNVDGDMAGERGLAAAVQVMKSWSGDSSAAESTKPSGGWDHPDSHAGRIGHVRIAVSKVATDVAIPRDKLDSLGMHVRNRIPDLPFAMRADYSEQTSSDPCTLLTRAEAEAVLGPLIVPPYRSGNNGPLAYPNGTSCAYFTAGHHVLIITPRWSGGKFAVKATRGIGGIAGAVVNNEKEQSADTLEGPWDEAAMDLDGRLALLKGDRLLEIQYLMSSTDEAGALKLARPAFERLTSSK
ncbi:MAG TPA: hypothetical protein VM166_06295 [Gemmatimonadaceae bacterium]|nr:hypothetical protein [Gemmatimonadaceae bacterium]